MQKQTGAEARTETWLLTMEHRKQTDSRNDTRLIQAVARGESSALAEIIRKFRPLVFRTALRIICDTDEAEDITQEVFIKIWRQAWRYDGRRALSTWLYRITCNSAIDHIRRHRTFIISLSDTDPDRSRTIEKHLPEEKSAEESIIRTEEWELFRKISEKLSPKQRIIFTLKDIEGLSTEEVIQITGLGADSIKSNLYLARKALREMLSKSGMVTHR